MSDLLLYAVANAVTGEIVRKGSGPAVTYIRDGDRQEATPVDISMYAQAGEVVVEGTCEFDKHYVDVATMTIRECLPSPIAQDGAVFSNIPPHSRAKIDMVWYDIDDTSVEFSFDFPGTYPVTIVSPGFLTLNATVTIA